jgi:hypothetical protein
VTSDAQVSIARRVSSVDIRSMARRESQIMYIARIGSGGQTEWARIGRVSFSKSARTLRYDERTLRGEGQPWYRDADTGEQFVIARAREDGLDRSEGRKRGSFPTEIDEDVREEYWARIRCEPNRSHERIVRS